MPYSRTGTYNGCGKKGGEGAPEIGCEPCSPVSNSSVSGKWTTDARPQESMIQILKGSINPFRTCLDIVAAGEGRYSFISPAVPRSIREGPRSMQPGLPGSHVGLPNVASSHRHVFCAERTLKDAGPISHTALVYYVFWLGFLTSQLQAKAWGPRVSRVSTSHAPNIPTRSVQAREL